MARATVAVVLHAHLPWVDPDDEDDTLESRWLLDALTDCYLPLLARCEALAADAIPVRFVCSLSPSLLAQLAHPTLPARYARHLDRLDAFLDDERRRLHGSALGPVVEWQRARLASARIAFFERHGGDLLGAWRRVAASGVLELWTTAASHAVLPLLTPGWARTQIELGQVIFRRHLGIEPAGFWLPECAYAPVLDEPLLDAGVRLVVLDTHGVTGATPRPVFGAHAPIATPAGLLAVARDADGSRQVWDAQTGFPGDPWYLDHHADVGWTRGQDAMPVPPGGAPIGIRYHRVTGGDGPKAPYEPEPAAARVAAHAATFVGRAAWRAAELAAQMDRPPLLVYAFDAELFGHWWAEGPSWLDAVMRALATHDGLEARTPSDDLLQHRVVQRATPAASTWGAGGHLSTWLSPTTAAGQAALAACAADVVQLVAGVSPSDPVAPAVAAAVGHVVQAQASDWPFMVTRDTSAPYGRRRLDVHLAAARRLVDAVRTGAPPERADLGDERSFPMLDLSDRWRTMLLS